MTGYIPKNISFVCKEVEEINNRSVRPAFVIDAENKKTKETAIQWAEQPKWNRETREYIRSEYQIVTRDNKPITGVLLCDLERRGEGGRAYKVVYPPEYWVDLREDILMETIQNCGIKAGGELQGEYLWAIVGSQMKLIRYESKLYNELATMNERRKINKKIKPNEWEVGGIYAGKNDKKMMFMGFVDTTEFYSIHDVRFDSVISNYRRYIYKYTDKNKIGFWLKIEDLDNPLRNYDAWYYYEFNNPKNLIIKLGQVELPADCIEKFRASIFRVTRDLNEVPHYRYQYFLVRRHQAPYPTDIPEAVKTDIINKFGKEWEERLKKG